MAGRQTFRIAWSLVVGAALVMATAGAGHAQDWGPRGHGPGGGPAPRHPATSPQSHARAADAGAVNLLLLLRHDGAAHAAASTS
jgi:hypothetical protein